MKWCEAMKAVKEVIERDVRGWHDLGQPFYERAVMALDTLQSTHSALEAERDETQEDYGREHGELLNARATIHTLEQRVAEAEGLLAKTADKLDAVHEESGGVFQFAAVHGVHYTGPTYEDELMAIRQFLTPKETGA